MEKPAVFQIVGYKNSGKTTLVCQLIEHFKRCGWRVGTAKHDGHSFDIDREASDTWKHRQAGADAVAISSAERTAWMEERGSSLRELLKFFGHDYDLVLAEGFKQEDYPKLVVIRGLQDVPLVHGLSRVKGIVLGIASDAVDSRSFHGIPYARIHETEKIAAWICKCDA